MYLRYLKKSELDLYKGNHKTLLSGIKRNIDEWKDTPCWWMERLSFIKCLFLLNYSINSIPIEIS